MRRASWEERSVQISPSFRRCPHSDSSARSVGPVLPPRWTAHRHLLRRVSALLLSLAVVAGVVPPPSASASSEVNTITGQYLYSRTDVAIAGRGPSLVFSRSYNSGDTRVTALGSGWTHSYAIRLNSPGDGTSDIILVGPQGRSDRYTWNPD